MISGAKDPYDDKASRWREERDWELERERQERKRQRAWEEQIERKRQREEALHFERMKKRLEQERRQKVLVCYANAVHNIQESKEEVFFGFDFLRKLDAKKHRDEKQAAGLGDLVKKVFTAIANSDEKALGTYLGPSLHKTKQDFNKKSYERYKKWLQAKPSVDFDFQARRLIVWYGRKMAQEKYWEQYEKDIRVKQSKFEALKKDLAENEHKEQKTKEADAQALQQEIVAYEKIKPKYEELEKIYKRNGLLAYLKTLKADSFADILKWCTDLLKNQHDFGQFLSLSNEQKAALKKLIREEFERPGKKLAGVPLLAAPDSKANAPAADKVKKAILQEEAEQKTLPRLVQAELLSKHSVVLRNPDQRQEVKGPQNLALVKVQIGEPEWHNRHQLVLVEQQRPKQSQLEKWLKWLEAKIDEKGDLAEILDVVENEYRRSQEDYKKCETEQEAAEKTFQETRTTVTAQFEREAQKFIGELAEEKAKGVTVAQILESQIGELPLNADCFSQDGLPPLHVAMKQYKVKQTPQSLAVVEMLMDRGTSPYDPNNKRQHAFKFVWDAKIEVADWNMIRLVFKHMPTFSPLTEKICKFVAEDYCPKSKNQVTGVRGFFYGVFHSHVIKKDRQRELVHLGKLIYDVANDFKEGRIIAWIKYKNKQNLNNFERSQLKLGNDEKPAEKSGGSDLHKKLLEVVKEIEAGKLDYFQTTEHEMREVAPEARVQPQLSSNLVPA